MIPTERLRIEKAAVDCGFEMTPIARDGGLELRSARFPESVFVRMTADDSFDVIAPKALSLGSDVSAATVQAAGYGELYQLLRTAAARARTLPNRVADEFRRKTDALPKSTEAERLVVQRVGQGLFRAALLDYWQGRCCVTGLDMPELLRASHIRPWALCDTDEQRLDVFNGLLLAPQLDALFDAGWMTVEDDGRVRLAPELDAQRQQRLGLKEGMEVRDLQGRHHEYLQYHHHKVWRGST